MAEDFKKLDFAFGNITVVTDEEEKKWEELEIKQREERKQKAFIESGVGEKYWHKTLDDFDAYNDELKNNLQAIKDYISDINKGINRTLWICGTNGNGKSHLGAMIVRECGGCFVESSYIEDEIENARSFKAHESLLQLRKRYSSYRMLVIDEVARFSGENEKKYLFKILNDRYNANKPTVLITNLTKAELGDYLGRAITDRFVENCSSVTFRSPSYRENERMNKFKGE